MFILEFISHITITVLIGFLAFSASAERLVVSGLSYIGYHPTSTERANTNLQETQSENATEPSTETTPEVPIEMSDLSSPSEIAGLIPHILLENAKYQQATIAAIPTTTAESVPPQTYAIADAVVNIYCAIRTKDAVRVTTGSGVFISPKGVVLTNAHVAQFLLLEEPESGVNAKCTLRMGNPAKELYVAELLYIPPVWVNNNAKQLTAEHPSGTGESDFALLYVTGSLLGSLPLEFPFLQPDITLLNNADKKNPVIAGGYPAEILRTDGPRTKLVSVIATTTMTNYYTYGGKHADLMTLAPSTVGERGSSGGPVTRITGKLIGMIATRGDTEKDGERSLRALTLSYIDREIKSETGFNLSDTMSGDLAFRSKVFKNALAPFLSQLVGGEIQKK